MQKIVPCVVLMLATLTDQALAEKAPGLASSGSVVIGGSSSFALSRDFYEAGSVDRVVLAPSIDYFVLDRLSIGVGAGVGALLYEDYHFWTVSVGPRAGLGVPLARGVVFWPQAQVALQLFFQSGAGTMAAPTQRIWVTSLTAPIVFEPARHFFIGIGPSLAYVPAQRDAQSQTQLGLTSVIGGWF